MNISNLLSAKSARFFIYMYNVVGVANYLTFNNSALKSTC